ncbi:bifunctional DNA primase/polymerase [Amycolatopsis rhabdoformis]|uniref:Bifunctional DNA primase/polymerase n=1 Tax=Amycolatopsis rhabdoformis TaxID=1448059 RepID=A0ABZ1I2J3_9PSEU|nr:bifunctional DNA primase/polymerase [Amycolatopsis rhabdoformis]WSE28389.1 bifunctional DNA primase/polymerase [Amycolatopsis rhabdoformis]
MTTVDNELLSAALDAAARGWHVFPLRPGTKRPAGHNEDDCPLTGRCAEGHRTWEQRATTDPEKIRAAWSHAPYGIGVATGPSGLCVIDLDNAKPGDEVPERWAAEGVTCGEDVLAVLADAFSEDLPGNTLTVRTPSGGLHLYYRAPGDVTLRNTAGDSERGLGWKIDTRAWGGYVVAPGTPIGIDRYGFLFDGAIEPLPAWLVRRLTPKPLPAAPAWPVRPAGDRRGRYLDAAVKAEAGKVHNAASGQRNAALYAAALALGQLVAGGSLPEDDVTARLMTAAGRHIACGAYSETQARSTIRSGIRAGHNRPRQVAA